MLKNPPYWLPSRNINKKKKKKKVKKHRLSIMSPNEFENEVKKSLLRMFS